MPPSDFQARVLRLIAGNRSPESHVAGGLALNVDLARLSADIDIFHDVQADLERIADADGRTLKAAGLTVEWFRRFPNIHSAKVSGADGATELDWAIDSDFRFFPAEPDPLLGWKLHPFDLATNKALAAAGRKEPRDAFDVVTIHETLFPLGAVVWAAVAKDPGYTPLSLLDMIGRFGRYHEADMARIQVDPTPSAGDLSRRLKAAIHDAEAFVESMPAHLAGQAYLDQGRVVQPAPTGLDAFTAISATRRGVWPIDPVMGRTDP
jgi:hypothetical protein